MADRIRIDSLPEEQRKPLFDDPQTLGFGRVFTDHMFTMAFCDGEWGEAVIGPYRPMEFELSSIVFHYAQEIFEGLKGYVGQEGDIRLFRPDRNIARMNNSARRMCMPTIDPELFQEAIDKLVNLDQRWIPQAEGTALYIRPTMIATQQALGVKASDSYLFFIILSPVGPYYAEGFSPIPLYVGREYVRAVSGGTGDAKTGGNYAASLLAGREAREKGCSQVLWLDGKEHRFIEEVGAMNIFIAFEGKHLVTPRLTGSILPGVTRASVLELAPTLGYTAEERDIDIDEVFRGLRDGTVTEVFGSGTAAVISPVGKLVTDDEQFVIHNGEVGPVARHLYDQLTGIQLGKVDDPFGWVRSIGQLEPAANA